MIKVIEQYVKKGSKVFVEGQLETRKWQDQNGQDRYTTEVVLRNYGGTLTMLDGRNSGGGSDSSYGGGGYDAPAPAGDMGAPAPSDLDDEIPF